MTGPSLGHTTQRLHLSLLTRLLSIRVWQVSHGARADLLPLCDVKSSGSILDWWHLRIHQRPDANFDIAGVPNAYDWGSPEDNVVSDPLSDGFQSLWNTRARSNTEAFRKVFHVVPDDNVHSWTDYREFYEFYFKDADLEAQGKDQQGGRQSRYEWGHVVRENFPGGIKEVKDCLAQLKGTIVEMPLTFLQCKSTLFAESQTC